MLSSTNLSYSEVPYATTEADLNRSLQRSRTVKRKAQRGRNLIKQRLCGLLLVVLSVIVFAIDHDCIGASIFVAVLGESLIASKKYHMSF